MKSLNIQSQLYLQHVSGDPTLGRANNNNRLVSEVKLISVFLHCSLTVARLIMDGCHILYLQ